MSKSLRYEINDNIRNQVRDQTLYQVSFEVWNRVFNWVWGSGIDQPSNRLALVVYDQIYDEVVGEDE